MALLTEVEFLRNAIEMLKEALKKDTRDETKQSVSRVITYLSGRIDSLAE